MTSSNDALLAARECGDIEHISQAVQPEVIEQPTCAFKQMAHAVSQHTMANTIQHTKATKVNASQHTMATYMVAV